MSRQNDWRDAPGINPQPVQKSNNDGVKIIFAGLGLACCLAAFMNPCLLGVGIGFFVLAAIA